MSFNPPILLIRKNHIINKLIKCRAVSVRSAKTLAEAGVFNPNGFRKTTESLVANGTLGKLPGGKYYLK